MKAETAISLTIAAVAIGGGYFLYKKFGAPVVDALNKTGSAVGLGLYDLLHPNVPGVTVPGAGTTTKADIIGKKAIIASLVAQGVSQAKAMAAVANWHVGQPAPNAKLLKL